MKVLVVGSGAREHALCLALSQDPAVAQLWCAPGNAGTAELAEPRAVDVTDVDAIAALAEELDTDLVVIGPEGPLVAGAADLLRERGRAVFGPSAAAARLEGSKAFAKEVMTAAGVPTAAAQAHDTAASALEHLAEQRPPYVVKYDGLAAGKGVTVTDDLGMARRAVSEAFGGAFGADQPSVVIEDHLAGPEVSLFAITDGVTVLPLQPAQDFKRIGDGDTGPNTGGMGAYSPLPWAPDGLVEQVLAEVLQPTVDTMAARGTPFAGLLYAGLAMTADGPRVIEFNARFGDPETQVVLARLATPLADVLLRAATGRLAGATLEWRPETAVTVVLAAPGYPGAVTTGGAIEGLPAAAAVAGVHVLHAGTRADGGRVLTSGGRVLSVTATGADLAAARSSAYAAVAEIGFDGMQFRRDIAERAAAGEVAVPSH